MPIFTRTIGIDYSGAETPTASLKGLRVYMTDGDLSRNMDNHNGHRILHQPTVPSS